MDTSSHLADIASIPDAVCRIARERPAEAALLSWHESGWQAVTYEEIGRYVRRVALSLLRLGISQGDRIAVLGANSPAWGVAYLAILQAGGTAVPLDRQQSVDEWLDVLDRAEVRVAFCALPEGRKLQQEAPGHLEHLIWLDQAGDASGQTLARLAETAPDSGEFPEVGADDLASLIFTSGTTGRSKGVMLSHRNILANALGMLAVVDIRAGSDRFLSVLPLSHCYECTCGFLAPLLAGARIYFARSLAPSEIIADLGSSGATFLLGVPLLYEKFAAGIRRGLRQKGVAGKAAASLWALSVVGRPVWRNRFGRLVLKSVRSRAGLGSVRYLISGGAPLPPEVGAALEALGPKLLQGYGLTETSPVATLNPIRRSKPASVGRPLPGVQVRIHAPNADGIGEVRIKGETVTTGYWRDDEATRDAFEDGWLKTGDLGVRGADDHLYIRGRSKNLIITPGGKNISPEEIELAVLRSPLVAEIIVAGAPARDGSGEEVFAYIHPDYDHLAEQGIAVDDRERQNRLLREELDRTTRRLAAYKRVVRFAVFPEPFTKTTSQKIKRYLHLKETPSDRSQ